MSDILVIRFVSCEGPGYLADFLDTHGISFHVVRIDHHEDIPRSLNQYRGLVLMGGPMSANDDLEWTPGLLNMVHRAHTSGIPLLGHCLGSQIIARALGAEVTANAVKEIGWHRVTPNSVLNHGWFAQLNEPFDAFHWHGETFSIPAGATRILSSDACTNQGFVAGNTLALQCHIEVTETMIRQWATIYQHQIEWPTATVQSLADMMDDVAVKLERLRRQAELIYKSWINLLN